MIYDERGIYVLSLSGATGFTSDGRRLWYTILEDTAAIPSFGDDGVLYSGGRDWILYAYKLEDRALTSDAYGPSPGGKYGAGSAPVPAWVNYAYLLRDAEIKARFDEISGAVYSGKIGDKEGEWISLLMETASGNSAENIEIRYRVTSLRLLGYIGSQEIIPWLARFFRRETDPVVKAAAAAAIGAIGVDPEGIAIAAFLEAASYPAGRSSEQYLIAVAAATGALCRFSGPPLSGAGARILTFLSSDSQHPSVRRQARQELSSLRM
jgi:outer membrane protein assembly factor BamB